MCAARAMPPRALLMFTRRTGPRTPPGPRAAYFLLYDALPVAGEPGTPGTCATSAGLIVTSSGATSSIPSPSNRAAGNLAIPSSSGAAHPVSGRL